MRLAPLVRPGMAVASGVCAGIAAGFLLTDGEPLLLAIGVLVVLLALGVSYLVLPREVRAVVLPIVAVAVLIRVAAAVFIHDGLIAAGRGGFVTGDDAVYADLSSRLARMLHGESASYDPGAESYLLGTFVYLETGVFYALGPKVLAVELLNAAMGGILVTFAFEIGRRVLSDAKVGVIAAVLVALFPSLILWSALNLKDSLALLLIAIVLWLLVVFAAQPRWWLVPASFVPLVAMASVRGYIFVGLALVIPLSVAVAPTADLRQRALTTALAVALSVFVLVTQTYSTGGIRSISDFDAERSAMAFGSNTSFADQPLGIRVAYVLLAPFPWTPRRVLDILPIPEMLIWYVALAGGVVTVLRQWRLWRSVVSVLLFVGGILFVLLMAEGNVGTLFRHRAMVVPFVLILAAPTFALAVPWSSRLWPNGSPRRASRAAEGRAEKIVASRLDGESLGKGVAKGKLE